MGFLQGSVNVICYRYSRNKKKREERKKTELKKREQSEKILKAIVDFINKDEIDIRKQLFNNGKYNFDLNKAKIVIKITDCSNTRYDWQANVVVNSVKLDLPKRRKRRLAKKIRASVEKREREEEERIMKEEEEIIKEVVTTIEKDS